MKFGKEFVSQMVPEWQEAYMDYTFLKNLLKDVQRIKQRQGPPAAAPNPGLKRRISLYRAFSGLTQKREANSPGSQDVEAQAILVNSVSRDGAPSYETTFLMTSEEGGEYELVYFRRLDDELNKVERFYRAKVSEVVKEAEMLDKQMDALIAFRVKVENPVESFDRKAEITRLASDVAISAAAVSASTPSGARRTASTKLSASKRFQMDVIEEGPSMHERDESVEEEMVEIKSSDVTEKKVKFQKPAVKLPPRIAPLEVLGNVKINNHLETPRSTIKGVLKVPGHTELSFTRENLRRVEEQLQRAFVEFYQKLRLLKSFSFLNMLAFSKIMKKYDKITSRSASKAYMKMVDNSYTGSSDDVTKLMDRVEATFIKHFSNSNRAKGMNVLRPQARRERHRTTFSVGYLAGCASALLIALIYVARVRKVAADLNATTYMDIMFPLYSLFGFIVLHLTAYATNIFYWRRYRVNYAFIFGFKQGTELGYRQVLLVGFGIAVLAILCVLSNLDMQLDPITKDYGLYTELLPLFLIVFIFIVLFLPFNVLYKSSRYFFLTCLFHCICAPLYKVTLPDFFLGDQLTSQVQAIRSLQSYVCYYIWGDFRHRKNKCGTYDVFKTFTFVVAVIPYSVRLLQCIRRFFEEKSVEQAWNGLKYFLTIVAVCLRLAIDLSGGKIGWKIAAGIVSAIAATYCTWWDFVHDWGVLNRNSKNRWLRDKLLVPHKNVYYIAMVANVLLRFAWLQTVVGITFSYHKQAVSTTVACLEIIRRGIWNFFRLENEHLNNVGKYRAFKSVPLPFSYDEDDDKEE